MAPESVEKTAFVTHSGLYKFLVMPFGLCNGSATLQRLMETVLAGLNRVVCLDYIDNILIIRETFSDHTANFRSVFQRLREAGVRLKPSKCHLVKRQVEYMYVEYVLAARICVVSTRHVSRSEEDPSSRTVSSTCSPEATTWV